MKCFYHLAVDGIGTCKSCQMALCPQCAVDLDKGLACRDRCESDVRALIQLVDSNLRHSPTGESLIASARRHGMIAAGVPMVMGAIFGWWGLERDEIDWFVVSLGCMFVLFGGIQFIRVLRLVSPASPRFPGRGAPRG